MVLTIPLPRGRRLTVSRSRAGTAVMWWRKPSGRCDPGDWQIGDDPGAGVREPRRPISPLRGGSVALPLDEL